MMDTPSSLSSSPLLPSAPPRPSSQVSNLDPQGARRADQLKHHVSRRLVAKAQKPHPDFISWDKFFAGGGVVGVFQFRILYRQRRGEFPPGGGTVWVSAWSDFRESFVSPNVSRVFIFGVQTQHPCLFQNWVTFHFLSVWLVNKHHL